MTVSSRNLLRRSKRHGMLAKSKLSRREGQATVSTGVPLMLLQKEMQLQAVMGIVDLAIINTLLKKSFSLPLLTNLGLVTG